MTSKWGTRSRMMLGASGALRSRVMLFLFRAYTFQCTLTPASRQSRRVSPRPGVSTLTTSAPKSASCRLSMLPATSREKSSTRTPSSGPGRPGSYSCVGSAIARFLLGRPGRSAVYGAVQWPWMERPAVELERISKGYREGDSERAVLRDVSVTIAPGEIAVLVGRSGSGKSTLLNMIAGIDRPTAGRVLVDGTDLTALDEDRRTRFRRRRIGFVFQFFNLIPLLTVEENLLLPLELTGAADAGGRARAQKLLDRVGLGGRGG